MKNLKEFIDVVLSGRSATFNLVTGSEWPEGSSKFNADITKLFGRGMTRELLVSGLVREFISKNGMELSIIENSLTGLIEDNHLVLYVTA